MNLHSLLSSLKIWRGYYTGFLRRNKGEKWVRKPQGLWILEFYGGAPRAKPVVPYFTPQWGDISRLMSGQAGQTLCPFIKGRASTPKCLLSPKRYVQAGVTVRKCRLLLPW